MWRRGGRQRVTAGFPPPVAPQRSPLPNEGSVVQISGGARAKVGRLLGQGGQGVVHELLLESGGAVALKWYYPQWATEAQWASLADLVERGAPHSTFLWPTALAVAVDPHELAGFGYVMPLRPPHYHGLYDHVAGRVSSSFRATVTLALELAHAFLRLHNEGLCYRDISFGNVFFDPATGHVLVCDNDNVGVDGVSETAVRGTTYFMAPEVMRGECSPSRVSDLHSLAVLLFYVLMVGHPLLGVREIEIEDLGADSLQRLLAAEPVFVFDPVDDTNRPDPIVHAHTLFFWGVFPESVRDKFRRAFTAGLSDPLNGRVLDGEWRLELARLRDLLVRCQRCGRQSFLDLDRAEQRCWGQSAKELLDADGEPCDAVIKRPPLLQLPRWTVALAVDTQLYPHHVRVDYDFSSPIGVMTAHPSLDLWGLRNLTDETWMLRLPDGTEHTVEPGKSASLVTGAQIDLRVRGAIATATIT